MTHEEPLDHVDDRLIDPDKRQLYKHLGVSFVVALVVFVGFVLPAEYGMDPTALGRLSGVADLYVDEEGASTAGEPAPLATGDLMSDTTTIEIAPGQGVEFKFNVIEGDVLVYRWSTSDDIELFFDMHAEPERGPDGYFESYRKGRAAEAEGALVAPFTGTHGWYWENTGEFATTVTLESSGFYTIRGIV